MAATALSSFSGSTSDRKIARAWACFSSRVWLRGVTLVVLTGCCLWLRWLKGCCCC